MSPNTVMVKNYRGRPVQLSAREITPEYVLVAGADRTKPIGFPRENVFNFNAALYERLSKAYEEGSGALNTLWSEAKRFEG